MSPSWPPCESIPPDASRTERAHVDVAGSELLSVALVGMVFSLAQSQAWGWTSPGVVVPIVASVAAGVSFVLVERRNTTAPLMDFGLLRRYPNYRAAVLSQCLAGMAEMRLGVLFPLIMILNLGMSPGLAGLALLPTTLPMIVVAPVAGRWYDRVGGGRPLLTGYVLLAVSATLLAVAVTADRYLLLLPGLFVYGVGLALVLTVNDPVSLDTLPESSHGQASGVSATAEQFGGAIGIAGLYLAFHVSYAHRLNVIVDRGPLADLTTAAAARLKADLLSAETTGLKPSLFDPAVAQYLRATREASNFGYAVAFVMVAALAVVAAVAVAGLVRRPPDEPEPTPEVR